MVTIPLSRLFALALLLWTTASLAADIQVKVDRDPVKLDESFHIVFTATEQANDDPDFTPLRRDFDIRSQGQTSRISVVNGQYSRQTQWTLAVMAKRPGDLTIPSIAFGKDRSPAQGLRVEAGGGASAAPGAAPAGKGELLIEVEAEPKNPYVQAQVLYTVRILSQVGLSNARLEDPKLENAVMERVTDDSQYETRRDGQTYRAIERRFAIFPQQSGRVTIHPPLLEAEVITSRHSLLNRFFSPQGGDSVRLRGEAIELNVRPIAAQFSGKHWLPAKELALEEALSKTAASAADWEPPQLAAGEPLTRTLKLRALASTVGSLPELASATVPGLRAYPDQPALNEERTPRGLKASREEKVALIPAQAGSYTLPEIAIPWWNTATDREEIARVPARTLTVAAGATAPQAAAPPVAVEPPPAAPAATAPEPSPAPPAESSWLWIGLAAFFALGWLLTALAWWLNRRPAAEPITAPIPAEASARQQRRRLRQACEANDAGAVRTALLAWAQAHWPNYPPRHLDDVAARGGAELAQEIARLNRASYGTDASQWNGAGLLRALDQLPGAGSATKNDGLEPLYRAG